MGSPRSKDMDYVLDLETLKEEDWINMKSIAQILYDRGDFGSNQFKCAIASFIHWIGSIEQINYKEESEALH